MQGWVNKPGDYKITPGLTVQGAVGAAGGPMFAADTKDIHLIRIARSGEKVTLPLDLDTTDMPVQEGDVVDVSYSAARDCAVRGYVFSRSNWRLEWAFTAF